MSTPSLLDSICSKNNSPEGFNPFGFCLIFLFFLPEHEYMELELRSVEPQGGHEAGGAPPTLVESLGLGGGSVS